MSTKMAGTVRDSYLKLVRKYPLSPVKNEEDLRAAQGVMDGILAKGRLSKGELAYLDTLSELVLAYEHVHHPIPVPSDAAMLRHLMDAKGVTQLQLHQATKISLSTISEILSGKRKFTKGTIGAFAAYFHVDKGLFASNF
jgi:HTH-type transcriptional regulator/antitoxin HigA